MKIYLIQGAKYFSMEDVEKLFHSAQDMESRLKGCTLVVSEGLEYIPCEDIHDLIQHGVVKD